MALNAECSMRIDVNNSGINNAVAVQGDHIGRKIKITFLSQGEVIDLTNCTATVKCSANDKTIAANDCNISDNIVTVELTKTMLAYPGKVKMQVSVTDGSGAIVSSPIIYLIVAESISTTPVEDTPDFSILADLTGRIMAILNDPAVGDAEVKDARGGHTVLGDRLNGLDAFSNFPNHTYNLIANHTNFADANGWRTVNSGTLTAESGLLRAVSENSLRVYADLEKTVSLNAAASVLIKIRARCTSGGTATVKPCWRTNSSGVVIDKSYIVAGNVDTTTMSWDIGAAFSDLWIIAKDGAAQAAIDRVGLLVSSGATVEVAHFEVFYSQDSGLTNGEVEALKSDVTQNKSDINALQTTTEQQSKDITAVNTTANKNSSDISALNGKVATLRSKDDYSSILHSYTTMITSDTAANSVFGNNYNNLPENSVVSVGYKSTTAQNIPYSGFSGNVISTSYREGAINGKTQIAISGTNRLLHRIKWGTSGVWTDWIETATKPNIYYVGGDSEHQSLTQLFIDLAGDTSEKTIYINPGTYDIYQEYRDAGIETPPDDVTSGDYLTRCVFVPPNTKLIGIGNVTLEWNPSKDSITLGESRTWSPLNVRYACYIENVSIHCKYGRYCIHDDSHNATDDQGVTHTYKNVRCVYEYSDGGYGFNNALGFGISQKNNYVFEDCHFEIITKGKNSAFYGHSSSGTNLNINESPNIIVKNCIIIGGSNNNRVVRLQSLNKSDLRIRALFEDCYIDGGIYLTLYYDDATQAFDVTLLKSGNPTQTIDQSNSNPYPINVYE